MNPNTDFVAVLEQAHATLSNRNASAAELKAAAELARKSVSEIDAESEAAPAREAQILAALVSKSIGETISALGRLDEEMSRRMLERKVGASLGARIEARAIDAEAAERARDPAVQREAQRQALFVNIPILFRTDYAVSQLGKSARSRIPRPQGRHTSYVQDFTVPRVLQDVMTATRVPGHRPPKYSNFAVIEWPNSVYDEDEAIVAPLRLLSEKSSPSEDEVQIAIDRAQHVLLNEFARVCAEIRGHYPGGLPRFFALPSFTTPRAMAAE